MSSSATKGPDDRANVSSIDGLVISDLESGVVLHRGQARTSVEPETAFNVSAIGWVDITDAETGEQLCKQFNKVHPENLSEALALCLANRPSGHIQNMVFGNGATVVNAVGDISYFPPNVVGSTAGLYNQTYSKVVDDLSPLNTDPVNNRITVSHQAGTLYTDLVVTCQLDKGEPTDQQAFDVANSITDNYVFSEIGLQSYDPSGLNGAGKLLCHVVFSPVQKSLNRTIKIDYTLRLVLA